MGVIRNEWKKKRKERKREKEKETRGKKKNGTRANRLRHHFYVRVLLKRTWPNKSYMEIEKARFEELKCNEGERINADRRKTNS